MTVRIVFSLVCVVLIIFSPRVLLASEWHVDGAVAQSDDGTTWKTAFKTIQEGIDAAFDSDIVIVAEGVYFENVHFYGKNIVLRSTAPQDPSVVNNTVIDGDGAGSVVFFEGTEDETCVLTGFQIRHGEADYGGGIHGGWTPPGSFCRARIRNNNIVNNTAEFGGSIYNCGGVIDGNTIYGNRAKGGGGVADCRGTIRDNTIERNSASVGGGLDSCRGTIEGNTILRNEATTMGGGLSGCDGTIRDNAISLNSAGHRGGGLHSCTGIIEGNTILQNEATLYDGGGLCECVGTIRNNTISLNFAGYSGGGLHSCEGTIEGNTVSLNRATLAW